MCVLCDLQNVMFIALIMQLKESPLRPVSLNNMDLVEQLSHWHQCKKIRVINYLCVSQYIQNIINSNILKKIANYDDVLHWST